MNNLLDILKKDIRFIEGLKSCINCGTCTAICPAASVMEYDPRIIMDSIQKENEKELIELLKSNTIWFCGECLSCKTRCPKGNTPGYIIQALRALSIESGLFIHSKQGQKQLAIKRTVGDHILKYGYCVYLDEIDTKNYPEQGPIWDWFITNKKQVLERLGASYKQQTSGTLRIIPTQSMINLKKIFDATGATLRFEKIEFYSKEHAKASGYDSPEKYLEYIKEKYELE